MTKRSGVFSVGVCIFGLALILMQGIALAGEKTGYGEITGSIKKPNDISIYAAYCKNIGDAAAEARAAFRANYLEELEARIEKRITALDAKRKALEIWMRRRDSFMARAQQNLVEIYTAMRPEAAAQQISVMDDETAAAILLNLKPRTASAILNEIQPTRAARLASVIAGSAKSESTKDKS